ncbi:MAG: imidazole glycerol phosphate synthase subunit HisH [Gemmatimonadetes bacterium]|nr:imidazole glycerol phosphate synthase subunit HisH [Gemmatimonadota bacterium]
MKLALFDYGVGNLHSLGKALESSGAKVVVTADWAEALSLDGIVLPGVGAFGHAARALPADRSRIREALEAGLPCLGICLGMQLLFDESDESAGDGIGLVPGRVSLMRAAIVPQMGWNDVEVTTDPIFAGIQGLVSYYANSFVCEPTDQSDAIAWSEYAGVRFTAALRRANTWGLQFHPEKSSTAGRRIVTNFVKLARGAR